MPPQADSIAVARYWFKRGIRTVPIEYGGKRPIGGKNWNDLRVTEKTIPKVFSRRCNVGGLWGDPSGGIVDIDLDTEESRLAASQLLPETFIYGRQSSPASHYLYRSRGARTQKWQTKTEGTFVELRSTGTQSVLPPSIHPEKEPYQIYHDVPFTELTPARLDALGKRIAAAALSAYHFPEKGSRHDYVLAIAGSLLWNHWDPSEVTKFCNAMLCAAGSEGEDLEKHQRTVANAIKNYALGNRIPGFRTLSQWMSGDTMRKLKDWLGGIGEMPPAHAPVKEKIYEVPLDLLKVPGLVGEVADWVSQRSYRQQPLFNLAAGLAMVALASRNRYIVDAWETPLQPYFLMIAPTASGKGASMDSVYQLAHRIGLKEQVFKGFQSYHALLDRLAMPPNMALWLWDEAARKLQSATRTQGSQEYQGITYLLELYGQGASCVPGLPGRKASIASIDYPFFLVMAAAQPEQLLSALTESDLQLGLVNRFILLDGGETLPPSNPRRNTLFPSRLIDSLREFEEIKRPKDRTLPFYRIRFADNRVYRKLNDFIDECAENASAGEGAEIWGRTAQNALICAGIVAVGCNPKRPEITPEIADWAIGFMKWVAARWQYRVEESSARSFTERGSKYLERLISRATALTDRAKGAIELKLLKRGLVPQSILYRMARHMRGKELEDTLSALMLADLIATGEVEGRICYWSKSVVID